MIAILIPVYKPEDTFEFFLKQLSSAIIERKADIKLVIVNDGNSPELLCFKNIPKENVHFVHHFINLGKDIDRVEVLRDFNGWSWTTIKKEIENIDANLVFQIFQLLLGKEFMDNWCQDKDGIIDFFEMMTSEFSEKYGNDRIEKLKEYLIKIAFANTIECNEEFKQELLEKISKLDCEIKQYEDTQNNIERI